MSKKAPLFISPLVATKKNSGTIKNQEKQLMLVNNNSSLTLSIILNKGQVKESSKRGSDVIITSLHNGSVTAALDTQKYFLQFRMYSDKQSEVPMFVKAGTKSKPIEQQISSKKFLDLFYGGSYIDTKFYVNLNEDVCEAINDSTCKSIKLTFNSSSLVERKDEEYQGKSSFCFFIEDVEIETLDTYYGIGRKVENNHVVNCIEEALEETVTKKINTVTATELKEKAEKFSKNGKRNMIKEVEKLLSNDEKSLEEFKSTKFSSEPNELIEQLNKFKARVAESQLSVVSESISDSSDDIEEAKELTKEENDNFLLSLLA